MAYKLNNLVEKVKGMMGGIPQSLNQMGGQMRQSLAQQNISTPGQFANKVLDPQAFTNTVAKPYQNTPVSFPANYVANKGANILAGMQAPFNNKPLLQKAGDALGAVGTVFKPVQTAQFEAMTPLFQSGMSLLPQKSGGNGRLPTRQELTQGFYEGQKTAPKIAALTAVTNPLINKTVGKVASVVNGAAGKFLLNRASTGALNIPEGMMINAASGNPYSAGQAAWDFGTGAVMGSSPNGKPRVKGFSNKPMMKDDVQAVLDLKQKLSRSGGAQDFINFEAKHKNVIDTLATAYLDKPSAMKGWSTQKKIDALFERASYDFDNRFSMNFAGKAKEGDVKPNPLAAEARKYKTTINIQDKNDLDYLRRILGEDSIKDIQNGKLNNWRGTPYSDIAKVNFMSATPKTIEQQLAGRVKDVKLKSDTFYHGTNAENAKGIMSSGFKAGSSLPMEAFRGGGYGKMQNSVSFAETPKEASIFSTLSKNGEIVEAKLRPNAKVVSIDGVEDAVELEAYMGYLIKQKIDAVYIGGGEKELVVINSKAVTPIKSQLTDIWNQAQPAINTLKHFTTPEVATKLKSGEAFDFSQKPIHGAGGMDFGDKLGRLVTDGKPTIYLSKDDSAWNVGLTPNINVSVVDVSAMSVTELKKFQKEGGTTSFNYDTQKWEGRKNAFTKTDLEGVDYNVSPGAKTLTIDSPEKLSQVSQEIGSHADDPAFWSKLREQYDIVDLVNVKQSAMVDETTNKSAKRFFSAAKADQSVVLNPAVVSVSQLTDIYNQAQKSQQVQNVVKAVESYRQK